MKIDALLELTTWLKELGDFAELANESITVDVAIKKQTCSFTITDDHLECQIADIEGFSPNWINAKSVRGPFNRDTWESVKKAIVDAQATKKE